MKKFIPFCSLTALILLISFYFPLADQAAVNSFTLENRKFIRYETTLTNADADTSFAMKKFDKSIKYFMWKWKLKGASVAVVEDGKLKYVKGYGYADKKKGIPANPQHLFRVASVSKLLTAAGIMTLCEQGKLSLDDRVFGSEGVLNEEPFLTPRDKKVFDIRIEHLLEHTSGLNEGWGDPMFSPSMIRRRMKANRPADFDMICGFMMKQRLQSKPGKEFDYSNFGYALLGKIIEKTSGVDYEFFIQKNILHPAGIYDMKLGKDCEEEKAPKEVHYYDYRKHYRVPSYTHCNEYVEKPYGGFDMEALSAAGSWIASPADLVRLSLALDGKSDHPDILSKESIERMRLSDKENDTHTLGWSNSNEDKVWRTGTLSGTSALLVQRYDGITYAFITNTGTHKWADFTKEIAGALEYALSRVDDLPETDLFEKMYTEEEISLDSVK